MFFLDLWFLVCYDFDMRDAAANSKSNDYVPRKIFIVGKAWDPELVRQLKLFRYQIFHCEDFSSLRTRQDIFVVIAMLDAMSPRVELSGYLILLSEQSDFYSRLSAVKFGASGFFVWPVKPALVLETLERWVPPPKRDPFRLLIFSHDKHPLLDVETYNSYGFVSRKITKTIHLLPQIREWMPDLILVQMEYSDFSGIEVSTIIRQHSEFFSFPIIFLSRKPFSFEQIGFLQLNGDEFFSLDHDVDLFLDILHRRAAYFRQLHSLADRDSLTGLLNHARIKRRLVEELARAKRNNQTLSFVMLDIDRFKSINDRFGHLNGDKVIRGLSQILKDRFRINDSVGRYGGEEFAIVMPRCSGTDALRIFNQLRLQFSQLPFVAEHTEFFCTFSAGIAELRANMSAEQLSSAADLALYQAKNNGRNQVALATFRQS